MSGTWTIETQRIEHQADESQSAAVSRRSTTVANAFSQKSWRSWAAVIVLALLVVGTVGCSREPSPSGDVGGTAPATERPGENAATSPGSSSPESGSLADGSNPPGATSASEDPTQPENPSAPAGDDEPAPSGANTLADFHKLDRSDERVAIPDAMRTDPGPEGPNQRVFWIREFCGYLPAEEAALFQRFPFRLSVYADDRVEYRTPQFRHFRATLTAEEKQVFHDVLRSGDLAAHPNTMIPVGVTDFGTTIIGGVVDGEVRETRYSQDVVTDPRFQALIEGILERALAYDPR